MNGPLLINMLPPERMGDPAASAPDSLAAVAILLLAGLK
jgi:hypothetical protein